jgi:hypothetical protein
MTKANPITVIVCVLSTGLMLLLSGVIAPEAKLAAMRDATSPSVARPQELPATGQTDNLVALALSRLARYDIYQSPVIVQVIYTSRRALSVLLLPSDEPTGASVPEKRNWRIEVSLGEEPSTRIFTNGGVKIKSANRGRCALGDAVARAAEWLSADASLRVPAIIEARDTERGFFVSFRRLPERTGGVMGVRISRDLKGHQIIRGY